MVEGGRNCVGSMKINIYNKEDAFAEFCPHHNGFIEIISTLLTHTLHMLNQFKTFQSSLSLLFPFGHFTPLLLNSHFNRDAHRA